MLNITINDDREYYKAQRRLGEIQVAVKLLVGVLKEVPEFPELEKACANAVWAQKLLMRRVREMERIA